MNKQAEGCINVQTKVFSKDAVLVLVASFFYMSCPMIVTPIITGFTGMLGGTGFVMGVIGGLVNLVSLGCRPVAGNLADKMDEYHLALAGSGLMLIGCIGYCVAPSILVLVLARVINGIGYACCSVSMSTWLSILLPKDKIGSGMGLYGTVQALGMAVAPAFGIKSKVCLLSRGICRGGAVCAGHYFGHAADSEPRHRGSQREEPSRKGLQIIDGKVVPIALIVMLFTIPYLATQSFLISYVEKKGIAVDTALFFPLYAVVLVALRSGFRNYFDKVPYRRFLFISMVSSVLALLSLNFMTSDLLMIAAAVFMAGGYGIMCSVSQAGAILLAGPGRRGIANSTYYVASTLVRRWGRSSAVFCMDRWISTCSMLFCCCVRCCALSPIWCSGRNCARFNRCRGAVKQ